MLLDADGVLIDSTVAHRTVWRRWAQRHTLDEDLVWAATHGHRPEDTIAQVAPWLRVEEEREELDRLLATVEDEIVAMRNAKETLEGISELPWAVVTSGSHAVTRARFERLALPSPSVLVAGEDVVHGKPDPEGYIRAAAELAIDPSECIVVEDAPSGVDAGRAAGCYVVAVCTTHDASALHHADAVVTDLAEAAFWLKRLLRLR